MMKLKSPSYFTIYSVNCRPDPNLVFCVLLYIGCLGSIIHVV